MDVKDLFVSQFEMAAYQVGQVFKDFPADGWDSKANPNAMSARETVAHLTEAYIACSKHLNGEKHGWGSYVPVDTEPNRLLAEMNKQRDVVKTAALAGGPEEYKTVLSYTTNHDCYHVGQMCTLRLHLDPSWDSESIYGG